MKDATIGKLQADPSNVDNLTAVLNSWAPRALSVLRVIVGFLFLQHGSQKLFNLPPGKMLPITDLMSQMGMGGILEFVGGILILLGLGTRPIAFILCGEMAVACFQMHTPHGALPIVNQGELAVLYRFVFLYLVLAGPGPWSIDTLIRKRKDGG